MNSFTKKEITKKSENISAWYNDIVLKAQLADYGPVKGTMVIRPYGYALWENVQKVLDSMFKKGGVQNAYFPLFIPMSFLKREKDHVEGFSPELAVVTIGGGEELEEPVVVRPTSETIMYEMYAKWIQSWRDLPLVINQWNNVVRWEKRTYLFLRTTEFLWQEGHTAHATEEEAIAMQKKALEWYKETYEDYYAMPVLTGIKSQSEKFAGAKTTYTVEALMPDGKALQACTSHNLGQNFSKAFDIHFQNREGKNDFVWQTSWGFSTRSLGGLFLAHGDDNGLVLPPKLAPIKIVILPVLGKNDTSVLDFCQKIKTVIEEAIRETEYEGKIEVWDESWKTMGWKANESELKGICLSTKIGPKEVEENAVTLVTRLSKDINGMDNTDNVIPAQYIPLDQVGKTALELLENLQRHMFNKAKKFLDENTHTIDSYEIFKNMMSTRKGFLKSLWCEDAACEQKIKEETKATTRCLPFDAKEEDGVCIYCRKPAKNRWVFAQAY
jgi:prolyl-tRNA synthetase